MKSTTFEESLSLRTSWSTRGKILVLLLVLNLKLFPLLAQNGLNLSLNTGPLLQINPVYPETTQRPLILEFGYKQPYQQQKLWQSLHPKLRIGVAGHVMRMGNPETLGTGIGGTADLHLSLFSFAKQKININLLIGTGIAWGNKPYDRTTNPTNNALGTHVNNLSRFALRADFSVKSTLQPFVSFSYTHLSNGHIRIPNLGYNVPSLGLGLRFHTKAEIPQSAAKNNIQTKKHFISARFGIGGTTVTAPDGPIYPVYLGAIAYNHNTPSQRFRWKIGLETFVSYASYAILKDYDQPFPQTSWNATGIIAFTGGELLLGRVGVVAHLGPYLKRAFQMDYLLYTKLGIKYYLRDQHISPRKQPFLGVHLHAHSGESDFLELGFGWNF
jgi:hypothetical protein